MLNKFKGFHTENETKTFIAIVVQQDISVTKQYVHTTYTCKAC